MLPPSLSLTALYRLEFRNLNEYQFPCALSRAILREANKVCLFSRRVLWPLRCLLHCGIDKSDEKWSGVMSSRRQSPHQCKQRQLYLRLHVYVFWMWCISTHSLVCCLWHWVILWFFLNRGMCYSICCKQTPTTAFLRRKSYSLDIKCWQKRRDSILICEHCSNTSVTEGHSSSVWVARKTWSSSRPHLNSYSLQHFNIVTISMG